MRIGVYTKDESRIENQRERDDYEWWHGPLDDLSRRDIIKMTMQTLQTQHDREAEKYYKETGERIDDLDANSIFNRVMRSEVQSNRTIDQCIAENYRIAKRSLSEYGRLTDYAQTVFTEDIIREYPIIHVYKYMHNGSYSSYQFHRVYPGSQDDHREDWQDIIIARKTDRTLTDKDISHGIFPEGTFYCGGLTMDYKEILSRFKNARIAVFGDVMIDRYIYGHFDRPSAEADIQIIKTDVKEELLGGAGSVASMITGFGASCRLYCGSVHSRCIKTRIIIDGKQYARYDDDQFHIMNEKEYAEHIEAFSKFSFDAVIFSDYNKGYLEKEFVKEIIAICRKRGIYVSVDPKPETIDRYEGAHLIKPNFSEARKIAGSDNIVECLYRIENDYAHDKTVLITDGGNGIWISGPRHIPGISPSVVDVTGCGDMVIAAFTIAYVSGADQMQAATIANVAAGMESEQFGCRQIYVNNLQKRLDKIIGME